MVTRIARLTIILTSLALARLEAQERPAAQPLFDPIHEEPSTAPGATCYVHARWIVVERQLTEEVGADLFVRARDTGRCDADSLPGDYVLRNEWAEYFLGLRGNVLFIDSGTGPDLRGLILVDLPTRRHLLKRSYVELVPGSDSMSVGLWDGYELAEPAAGCDAPEGGLLPGVDSLFVVDLRTGAVRFGGRTRCALRQ